MRRDSLFIANREAYSEGFNIDINLALEAKKITFESLSFLKALLSPSYIKSHTAGIRDGYRQGLWRYEKERQEERLQELSKIALMKSKSKDHERYKVLVCGYLSVIELNPKIIP